ncbi:tetratricopeptide repeat protein [Winogradskyella litorisediminis]|uniref:Tetratricopeptide repeat protein n=1 Tax=Winogradskyella litorisediminis TaxID=1156618 RepID=A0ABW3N948_9FLAO
MNKYILIILYVFQINAEAQSSALDVADSLYANGNYTKAINSYLEIEDKHAVYSKIAKAYLALGNRGKALENYKLSTDANPDDALIKYEYAKLLLASKKYKEASDIFEKLIYIDYKNPNYHYQKGLALEKLNDSTALNRFLSAYNLDDTHQKAIYKIARHHLVKRHHQLSHRYIDKGLESYAENIELISLKAQNYYYQEYHDQAITWFNKLIELGETSEFIHEKLSLSYAKQSDYKEAIYHRTEALKYNPYNATAMYVIGTYYEKLKDYKQAEEFISKSLNLKDVPLNDEYIKLGRVLNYQKKYAEAIVAYQKAVKEKPQDLFAQFALLTTKDQYYADKKTVIKLYEKFIEDHPNDKMFKPLIEHRISELKKEEFMNKD